MSADAPLAANTVGVAEPGDHDGHLGHGHQGSLIKLAVGAVGVVFGDIGTSPIYAFRETFANVHHQSRLIPAGCWACSA